ncbi:MAG: hypothetical protein ABH861_03995 [Patescibacteria group bacterium]|nr:hypothetical protein [Patescibacteria group bacterium]
MIGYEGIEYPLVRPHPCFRLKMSFQPLFFDGPKGKVRSLIDQALVREVCGQDFNDPVVDHESEIVVLASHKCKVTIEEVRRLLSPPEQAEIEERADAVKITAQWEQMFEEKFGGKPRDKDRRASQLATARKQIANERRFLTDLPNQVKHDLFENHADLFRIEVKTQPHGPKTIRQYVTMQDIVRANTKDEVVLSETDGRKLRLTGKDREYVAVLQEPRRKKGLVLIFSRDMIRDVLATKIQIIRSVYQSLRSVYEADAPAK